MNHELSAINRWLLARPHTVEIQQLINVQPTQAMMQSTNSDITANKA